jgi:3-hydroxyisobutyrate dehydrogenase
MDVGATVSSSAALGGIVVTPGVNSLITGVGAPLNPFLALSGQTEGGDFLVLEGSNFGAPSPLNCAFLAWWSRKLDALAAHGAIVCTDAAGAAANVPITIVCVVDALQCESVLWGEGGVQARPGGLAGHTVMLCPTIAPADVERFAARLAQAGADIIDAPMSGGPQRAADGTMSLMVACAATVRASHGELINALSNRVFHLGERPGDGARMKLVNNLLAGINLVGAAEALSMAKRMGMELGMVLDVIEQSSGQSWIGSDRMRRAIANDYAPRAHATLLRKDTTLAVQAGRADVVQSNRLDAVTVVRWAQRRGEDPGL